MTFDGHVQAVIGSHGPTQSAIVTVDCGRTFSCTGFQLIEPMYDGAEADTGWVKIERFTFDTPQQAIEIRNGSIIW